MKPLLVHPLVMEKYIYKQQKFKKGAIIEENSYWFNWAMVLILIIFGFFLYKRYKYVQEKKKLYKK